MRHVACPVALHPDGGQRRIAVFKHPLAGLQLVKGAIHAEELPAAAAARELFEESGLETRAALPIGTSGSILEGEQWHFALCRIVPPVRDRWQHLCKDGGGQLFQFKWMPLDASAQSGFEPRDLRALDWIRGAL